MTKNYPYDKIFKISSRISAICVTEINMQKTKRTIAALTALLILIGATLCSCKQNKDENDIPESECVMTVSGHEVSYGLYRYFFLNYKSEYSSDQIAADPDAVYSQIEEKTISSIKGMYALIDFCAEHGITTSDPSVKQSVEQTINNIKAQYADEKTDKSGEKGYAEELKRNFMTDSVLRFVSAVDACETELFTKLLRDGTLPSDDAKLKEIIEGEEFIRVLQIYVSLENGENYETNKQLAQKVYADAMAGKDFDSLISDYSNDYTMTKNGYYICHGYMNEKFEQAAYSLNVGEISGIVELPDGFHIIRRYEKENSYIEEHLEDLAEQYQTCLFYNMLDEREATVTYEKKDVFSSIDPALIAIK